MLPTFGQYHRFAAIPDRLDNVRNNLPIPGFITYQRLVQRVELNPGVFVLWLRLMKLSGSYQDTVCEGAFCSLLLRVYAVSDGATMHEDNGMVAILTRHRS